MNLSFLCALLLTPFAAATSFSEPNASSEPVLTILQEPAEILETDIEKLFERAAGFVKAYDEGGWEEIKDDLAKEKPFIKTKVLYLAMSKENVPLTADLLNSNLVEIENNHYDYAINLYRESGSENLESIIDMFSYSYPELGSAVDFHDEVNGGHFLQLIADNDYPMLERVLDGATFKIDSEFADQGTLLGISVLHRCSRCVKILIDRGADVNYPILADAVMKFDDVEEEMNPLGWTPLMIAVADGNMRIVKHLIESRRAFVSRTPKGREDERFHARAVARMIENVDLRNAILGLLKLDSIENYKLTKRTKGKTFIDAVKENDVELVDYFLLLRPETINFPEQLDIFENECDAEISKMLSSEQIALLK